ncbi:hypothetical protein JW698_02640, partial [Candidatus Wolfebacteria bacterium]|nr:hypothetical protein [Candidatus Wolfebacteria bacterium]
MNMETSLTKLFPKNWLPTKNWEEISRINSQKQILLEIGHLNPEINMVPELKKDMSNNESVSKYESIVYHGISTRKGSMKDFFEAMAQVAISGLIPGITLDRVQDLRKQYKEAGQEEKYDLQSSISIAKFDNEKQAESQLSSMQIIQSEGIDKMPLLGMEENNIKNLEDFFKNEQYKSILGNSLSKEQIEQFEKIAPQLKEVSEKMKEVQQNRKDKVEYYQREYLGYSTIFLRIENSQFKQPSVSKIFKNNSKKIKGSGGIDTYVKMSTREKPVLEKYKEICLGLKVNNFIISGALLSMISSFPIGSDFCHSLRDYKKKIETDKINGQVYRTIHILPVNSTLSVEGYFNKEEAEEILKKIFNLI